jgi:hypothetical protein
MATRRIAKIDAAGGPAQIVCLSQLRAKQTSKIADIRKALIAAGVVSSTKQAVALGLSRSTAWAVLKGGHKGSGLSAKIIRRILKSPNLPPTVRIIVEEYVREKLLGAYGHSTAALRLFHTRLG